MSLRLVSAVPLFLAAPAVSFSADAPLNADDLHTFVREFLGHGLQTWNRYIHNPINAGPFAAENFQVDHMDDRWMFSSTSKIPIEAVNGGVLLDRHFFNDLKYFDTIDDISKLQPYQDGIFDNTLTKTFSQKMERLFAQLEECRNNDFATVTAKHIGRKSNPDSMGTRYLHFQDSTGRINCFIGREYQPERWLVKSMDVGIYELKDPASFQQPTPDMPGFRGDAGGYHVMDDGVLWHIAPHTSGAGLTWTDCNQDAEEVICEEPEQERQQRPEEEEMVQEKEPVTLEGCFNGVCELASGPVRKRFPESVKTVGEYKQLYGEFPGAPLTKGAEIAWKATKGTAKTVVAGGTNVVKALASTYRTVRREETIESLKKELKEKDAEIADLKAELEEQTKEKERLQQLHLESARNVKDLPKKNTDLQEKNKDLQGTASGSMSWLRKARLEGEEVFVFTSS